MCFSSCFDDGGAGGLPQLQQYLVEHFALVGLAQDGLRVLLEFASFAAKTAFFLWLYVWVRWSLPRFRYDQLMDLGWKVMIPASLGWFMLLAAQRVGSDAGWDRIVVTLSTALILIGGYALLQRAAKVSRDNREKHGAGF